jgi:hypothetical protein
MEKQRTNQQNKACHKYYDEVAKALNEHGVTVQTLLENYSMEIDWTPASVKDLIWRYAQRKLLKKESTTELESNEIDTVYEHVNRFLAQVGIHVAFPSDDGLEQITEKDM